MPTTTRYDAVIIGARCAGAATALEMARRGMRVLVVDKGEYGSDTLSTHALMRGAVIQLQRWGVLERIVSAGTPAVRTTTFHYGDEVLAVEIRPSHGTDALYAPRRTLLDVALVDAARQAGVDIRHRHALTDVRYDRDGRVRGVTLYDPRGQLLDIEADLVVGADGAGSVVARLVDAPVQRVAQHATAVIYGYWPGLDAEGYHWYYKAGLSAGVIPTNDNLHCVFYSVPPQRLRSLLRDPVSSLISGLAEFAPVLAAQAARQQPDRRPWSFGGRKGFMRQPYGPGWALVGDAGYFKDPLTAHGITDAFRDAELLAEAAADGTTAAFQSYADIRDRLSLPLFEVTDAIASFQWSLEEVKELHQALNRAMKMETEAMAARRSTLAAA